LLNNSKKNNQLDHKAVRNKSTPCLFNTFSAAAKSSILNFAVMSLAMLSNELRNKSWVCNEDIFLVNNKIENFSKLQYYKETLCQPAKSRLALSMLLHSRDNIATHALDSYTTTS